MKKYKNLLSFGCSFTYGGGLNSPQYHAFLTNTKTDDIYPTLELENYAQHHSFPGYLSRLLECPFINYGVGSGANEMIYETIYDTCSSINFDDAKSTLVTIQTSVLSRMYVFDSLNKIAHTINNLNSVDIDYVTAYYS